MIQPADAQPDRSSLRTIETTEALLKGEPPPPPSAALAASDEGAGSDDDSSYDRQQTLSGPAVIEGRGLFLGEPVRCTILPAPADHGIVFERVDLEEPVRVPASIANVTSRSRRTTLKLGAVTIETTEHVLSALAGLQVDNALIQLTGPEPPCGDGSAKPFVDAILSAGLTKLDAERRYHRITEPITVEEGDSMLAALPSERATLQVLYDLDYGDDSPVPRQLHSFRHDTNGAYVDQIAPSRTFSLVEEAKALWERGMCQHLTPRDVLVIGDDGPIENVYRYDNEPVRHKILDLIGDLYLIGRLIQGRIVAYRSGHSLNHRLAQKLYEQIQSQQRSTAARKRSMDIQQILRLMRHRYPMLLIDRLVEIEGDRRAVGVKNVTINEPFFQGHYPGAPIMPGVLIVEAMAQLSGLLLSRVLQHTGKIAVLLSLDRVKLRRPVVPGDQLVMEAEAIRAQARTANVKCKAFVDDQLVAEAHIKFIMVDADQE